MSSKKEFEQQCFELFSDLKFGSILAYEQLNPPDPDISLEINNKRIGIELTTIYKDNIPGIKDSQLKKNESLQDAVCRDIQKDLHTAFHRPIEIHIGFTGIDLNGSDVPQIAKSVTDLILPNLRRINVDKISIIELTNEEDFPNSIYRISIIYIPSFTSYSVTGMISDFSGMLSQKRVKAAIEQKEDKSKKYDDLYDEKWLLLCIQADKLSSDFDLSKIEVEPIKSDFNKVFILQLRAKHLIELK